MSVRSRIERKTTRRKIRWARLFLVLFVLLVVVITITGAASYAYFTLFNPSVVSGGASASKTTDTINKRINILILGLDDGDVDQATAPKRSDTIIVASINPQDSTINLLSIPRDTRLAIPGQKGLDKITHAHAYGGPQLTKRTVEEFLNIPIDYYIEADWQGFMKAVDILGGVDLYVERNMNYEDPYANLSIHLTKGYQHLDGQKAGEYVRFRHDELGDIGRVQRQQRLLKTLGDEMFQIGTVFKLPALVSTLRQYISTDMSAFTMLKLANTVKGFSDKGVHAEMLPGNFATIERSSYWVPDKEQSKQLVENLFSATVDAKVTGTVPAKTRTN
jgi:polyisoprenyl-teichoic acid--peptidoglycan teichoic acid transferase